MAKNPTIVPASSFGPEEDSRALKEAFKGFGTDEQAVIDILTKRSNAQRQEIAAKFKTMYGKDLVKELKSELRGNFEDVVVALMIDPVEYYAKQLHKAISGIGTNEGTIIEILGIHSNAEILAIAAAYEEHYGTSLESDIKGDTSGTTKRLLRSLVTAHRDETEKTDQEAAYKDAQTLLRAGELFAGTDESVFNEVLCQRNRSQLRLVFEEYQKITGHDFEAAIENEFSGTAKSTLLDLVRCVRDKVDFLAGKLHSSMEGMGTDDTTLIRIVVARSENDLGNVKKAFERKFGKGLGAAIEEDTSGDYKRCLLSIVG